MYYKWLFVGIYLEPVALVIQIAYEVSLMNEVGRDSDFVCSNAESVCGKTQEFLLTFP